jgi:uncharacterized protein DUF4189
MRRAGIFVAAATLVGVLLGAEPAWASYGAVAYDQTTGRYGFSWSKPTQDQANEGARKDCGSDKCRVIPVPPAKCGALANSADPKESNAWGVSIRENKSAAELAAIQNCQQRTSGQCKIRGSECNR